MTTDDGRGAGGVTTLSIGGPICRRCVRRISARVGDVPGVVALEVRAGRGLLVVRGSVDAAVIAAAVRRGGY
ncbi:cation transporter [Dactylosporangium salmoneum]|uniref:HMA domain-containing protein n=1 Tax=Dactylosporangium salmoneum TaxID=53361 RepID=A0ABN3FZ90_9ACTN